MIRLFSTLINKKEIYLIASLTFHLLCFSQPNKNSVEPASPVLERLIKVPEFTGKAKELMNQIEEKQDIHFSYSSNINLNYKVNFQQKQMKLIEFLDILFKSKGIAYKAKGNKILLFSEKPLSSSDGLPQTISGIIIDNESHMPLPYAHVQIQGTGYGITSDLEGKFNFKAPSSFNDSTLVISYVGYESAHIPVASFKNNFQEVQLTEAVNEISEVVVAPPNPVHVIANVLHHLDTNFWQTPFNAHAEYREFIVIDNKIDRISEAECELYIDKFRQDYTNRAYKDYYSQTPKFKEFDENISLGWVFASPNNQVKIKRLIHCNNPTPSDIRITMEGGPMGAYSSDFFIDPSGFFTPEKTFEKTCKKVHWAWNNYIKYDVWNGRTVYRQSFGNASTGAPITFFIDKETYALIGFDRTLRIKMKPQKLTRFNKRFKKGDNKNDQISWDSVMTTVRYMPIGEEWYPFSTVAEYYYTYIPYEKDTIQIVGIQELKYSSITTENATKFDPDECFKFYNNSSITDLPDAQMTERILSDEIINLNTQDPSFKKKLFSYSAETNSIITEDDSLLTPPVAYRIADTLKINDEYFVDYYSWLEETDNDQVMDYIEQENNYADWCFKQYDTLVHNISGELDRKYIHPWKSNDTILRGDNYIYFIKEKKEENGFEGILRRNKYDTQKYDTVLDFRSLEKVYPNYDIDGYTVNKSETIFSFNLYPEGHSIDNVVSVFRNIETGKIIDTIKTIEYIFINDSTVLYPMKANPECFWESQLYSKVLGKNEPERLKETEGAFGLMIESESERYVFIYEYLVNNILFFDKKYPKKGLQVFADKAFRETLVSFNHFKESSDILYTTLEEGKGKLYKLSSQGKPSKTDPLIFSSEYEIGVVFATDETIYLSFYDGLKKGLMQYDIKNGTAKEVPFPDTLYKITFRKADDNNILSLRNSTYTEPSKYYKLAEHDTVPLLIACDSLENYDKNDYTYKVLEVEAHDGKMIPVVMLYKKGILLQSIPVYVEFYGGGADIYSPNFDPIYLPLLNRGIAVVYPIIRGGGELGKEWCDELNKENLTIGSKDVINVVKYLIENNISDTSKITLSGGSFSGFLLSNIVNNYPDLMASAIIDVPENLLIWQLADSTDASVVEEYPTWGSPYVEEELERLKVIDPYENIKEQNYPPMLYFAGLRDINVSPVDAIRSVAKIRHADTSNDDIILRVLLNSGHCPEGGKYYTELAWSFAFALMHSKYK